MSLEQLLTTEEVAALLRLSPRSLETDRVKGKGLPYIKIGASVRYRASDVRVFIDDAVRRSTSQEVA